MLNGIFCLNVIYENNPANKKGRVEYELLEASNTRELGRII